MTYETTKTGAQVDALLDGAVQKEFTGPSTAFDMVRINLPGLTDAPEAQLEWRQLFANVPQADGNNRVMKMGYFRTGGDPEGPGAWWLAIEPFYQVGANAHNWKELHFEVVGRNDVQYRMLSGWVDIGPNTHSGGIVNSIFGSRFHEWWWVNVALDAVSAKVGATEGDATFLFGRVGLNKSGDRIQLNVGPLGNQWEGFAYDIASPRVRFVGPFVWYDEFDFVDLGGRAQGQRRSYVTNTSGNTVGFVDGNHATHRLASTDVFGTPLGGIRNDGSLHTVPVAVSALPAATAALAGTRAAVNDCNTTTFWAVVAGGGGNTVPVFCTGSDWRVG